MGMFFESQEQREMRSPCPDAPTRQRRFLFWEWKAPGKHEIELVRVEPWAFELYEVTANANTVVADGGPLVCLSTS